MRLRSANRGNGYNTWYVNPDGNVNNNNAYNAFRSAPDCVTYGTDGRLVETMLPNNHKTQGVEFPVRKGEQYCDDASTAERRWALYTAQIKK